MTVNYQQGFHWTPKRKAFVVDDLRAGRLSRETAIAEHGLSPDELDSWIARYDRFGARGLCVTRLQEVGR